MVECGMGLHADTVPLDRIVLMAKLLLVAEILYAFNLVWTKLSLLMMYCRIFRFPYFKKWAYIIGTFVILWVICMTPSSPSSAPPSRNCGIPNCLVVASTR